MLAMQTLGNWTFWRCGFMVGFFPRPFYPMVSLRLGEQRTNLQNPRGENAGNHHFSSHRQLQPRDTNDRRHERGHVRNQVDRRGRC